MIGPLINTIQIAYSSSMKLSTLISNYDIKKYNFSIDNITYYQDERYTENVKNIYNILNKNGAIYIDASCIDIYYSFGMNPWGEPFIPIIGVNKTYLNDYKIISNDGNTLDLDTIKGETYLVPEKYKDEDYNKYYLVEDYNSLIIENGMSFYNPSIVDYMTFIEEPVILILDEYNNNIMPIYPFVYFSNEDIVKKEFKKAGLQDICRVLDTSMWFNHKKILYTNSIIEAVEIVLLYSIIISVFLYQSIYLYMEESKKVISIQYFLGQSKFKRYSEIFIMNLSLYLIVFIVSLIFLKLPILSILAFIILYILLEFMFMISVIRRFEKNSIVSVLKTS